jgi:F0F1-type ATP synthase membrane subunit c/vacuolar-type H+-ATPase subunit K
MAKSRKKTTLIVVAVLGAILVAATAIIGLVSGFINKDDLREMGIRL